MKKLLLLLFIIAFCFAKAYSADNAIIIDHACTKIDSVPANWIEKAKSEFRVAYGHTSHGSQIISGMTYLNICPAQFTLSMTAIIHCT